MSFKNKSPLEERLEFLSELVEKAAEKMGLDLNDGIHKAYICPNGCHTSQVVGSPTYIPKCSDCGRTMIPPKDWREKT